MGELSNLKHLMIRRNQLEGEIPAELGNLINLRRLFISGNQLTGCLPAAWESADLKGSDLELLDLAYCEE